MTGKDIPAWIVDGRNNAGTIAKSQIKIGDGNTNPDAGLHSSVATLSEAISVAPQKPGVLADSEPKTKSKPKSKSEPKKQKAQKIRRASGRTTPKTPRVAPAGIVQASVADPAPAIAPIPDSIPAQSVGSSKSSDVPLVVNATELQKEKKQPTREELAGVKDFDGLFLVLEKYDGIQGSSKFYSSERLRNIIGNVRQGSLTVKSVTSSKGLRDVVARLLQEEREPYVSGNVFAEQILEEQDNRKEHSVGKENIMTPESPEAEAVLKKFGKPDKVLNQGISQLEKQIKELYITTTDKNGKVVEAGKLVELRKEYAEAEYRNVGVWQRLREKLGVRKKESDSVPEREVYHQALQQLISLKIDELKLQKNIPPEELKKKMVETLQFFGTESKIRLYEAWTQATMKREGFSMKIKGLCEDFGNQYNKLKLWQKVGLGAVALGTSVATGGGAMATGMLVARRAAAGLGSFSMFEGVFEKRSQNRASNIVENKVSEAMIGLEQKENVEARLNHLMETLKSEMSSENLRQELHDRAKGKTLRTISAAAISFGMMFGIPALGDHIKDTYFGAGVAGNATDVAKKGVTSAAKAAVEHGAPAPGAGAVASEQLKNALESGTDGHTSVGSAYAQPSPGHFDAPSGVTTEAVKTAVEAPIPADYVIEKGDTTWHILDGYLTDHDAKFAGMSEGQQTHAIDALKDKLKLLTPAQLKEAGFSSGNIDELRIGDTVHLDKLLGAVDADKAIASAGKISAEAVKNIEANNVKIAEWASAHPGEPYLGQSLETTPSHVAPASHVMNTRGTVQLPPSSGAGVPPDYIPDASDAAMDQAKQEISKLQNNVASAQESINALAMQPRVDGWIKPMLESVPEGSPVSSISMAEMKKIPLKDIQYAMTHDSADAYERVHMTRDQFANVKQFIQGAEKDRLVPPLNDIVGRKPDLKIGDYITKIALDPKVKVGYMVGGRGGFSTSI